MARRTADPETERSSCCGAAVTFMEGELCCKACYHPVAWETDDGTDDA